MTMLNQQTGLGQAPTNDEVRNRETTGHMGRKDSCHSQHLFTFHHLSGLKDVNDDDAQLPSRIPCS
jgi:hypothetical protein